MATSSYTRISTILTDVIVRFLVSDNHQLSLFRDDPLFERLVDFGLTDKQAKDALQTHESDYIGENLDIVEGLLEAGRIKSTLAAATVDALKTDYRKRPARREQKQTARASEAAAERAAHQAAKMEAERRQALEIEFEVRQLDAAIAALSEDQRQALERDFVAGLEDRSVAGALVLLESFRKSGFASAGGALCVSDLSARAADDGQEAGRSRVCALRPRAGGLLDAAKLRGIRRSFALVRITVHGHRRPRLYRVLILPSHHRAGNILAGESEGAAMSPLTCSQRVSVANSVPYGRGARVARRARGARDRLIGHYGPMPISRPTGGGES